MSSITGGTIITVLVFVIIAIRSERGEKGRASFKKRWGWLVARVVTALEFVLVPMLVALFNCTFSPYFRIETEAKKEEDIVANLR
jgi:hypothetical protein